ncbi:MAG: hypothetical protein HC905_31645 [Bacteroidales bacterium]|nr:hypothetical protein [Bacteroidales bacterium]
MEEFVRFNTEAELRVVLNKYYIPVFYYVEQKVKSKEASEEITQETFLKLWEKRKVLKLEPKALTSYLYKIAHNESINFLKAESSRKLHQQQDWKTGVFRRKSNQPNYWQRLFVFIVLSVKGRF